MPSFQVAKKDHKDRLSQSSEDYLETRLSIIQTVTRGIILKHLYWSD